MGCLKTSAWFLTSRHDWRHLITHTSSRWYASTNSFSDSAFPKYIFDHYVFTISHTFFLVSNSIADVPWFHGIFHVFSLSLVYVKMPFCINFYVSFFLFARNLSKYESGSFRAKKCRKDHLWSLWLSVGGIVVKLMKDDGEVWLSVGLRKTMMDGHCPDGSSCWFIAMIRK